MFIRPGQAFRWAAFVIALSYGADAQPQAVERTSADDCAIMALAGKELLGWGTERPKYSIGATGYSQAGREMYVIDCPWRELGVAVPDVRHGVQFPEAPQATRIIPPASDNGWHASFSRPQYDPAAKLLAANFVMRANENTRPP